MSKRTLIFALGCAMLALALPATSQAGGGNPFKGARLYADPAAAAARQVRAWSRSRPADAAQVAKIARTPAAEWLGGWVPSVGSYVHSRIVRSLRPAGAKAFFVLYNIPNRDCGGYSSGGAGGAAAYRRWIDQIRSGIGGYPAMVVVEPDALAVVRCLNSGQLRERLALERYAVRRLGSLKHTSVYLDAGGSSWPQARTMTGRLRGAGVRYARGFALNTTGYQYTSDDVRYGRRIAGALGRKHFIVNTSRNGRGPLPRSRARSSEEVWCNPRGRGIGRGPTTKTGHPLVDAFAWFSNPGFSDGPCNGGPPPGRWWPALALAMAQRGVQ